MTKAGNQKSVHRTKQEPITPTEYRAFQLAYDFFNRELFDDALPPVMVTLQRRGKTRGYFSPERFDARQATGETAHEIALNPDNFTGRSDEGILSTLVHEMVHGWQHEHGSPGRGRYHNREWANAMKRIGLCPSHTGEPGGKETGQRVTHYIIDEGPYRQAYRKLQATGFELHWQSRNENASSKAASKTKFTCPDCKQNAWAKADALLSCGACGKDLPMRAAQTLNRTKQERDHALSIASLAPNEETIHAERTTRA